MDLVDVLSVTAPKTYMSVSYRERDEVFDSAAVGHPPSSTTSTTSRRLQPPSALATLHCRLHEAKTIDHLALVPAEP